MSTRRKGLPDLYLHRLLVCLGRVQDNIVICGISPYHQPRLIGLVLTYIDDLQYGTFTSLIATNSGCCGTQHAPVPFGYDTPCKIGPLLSTRMPHPLGNEERLPRLPQVPGAKGTLSLGETSIPALTANWHRSPPPTGGRWLTSACVRATPIVPTFASP